MKNLLLNCFMICLLFSCDNSSNFNSIEEFKKDYENSSLNRTKESVLKDFAKKHIQISKEIIVLLKDSQENISFDDNSYFEIYNLKTEQEIFQYFTNKGIKNPLSLIQNLKELEKNYDLLIKECPEYANLSSDQKHIEIEKYLSEEISEDSFFFVQNGQTNKISCQDQYKIDINRCYRNQAIGLGFSFVTGVITGGIGGWLGAAASTTAYHYCVQDAIQDLNNCRNNDKN